MWPVLLILGISSLIIYGASRSINLSRLTYAINKAAVKNGTLGLSLTVANPLNQSFVQDSLQATLYLNNMAITSIQQNEAVMIEPAAVTGQGFVVSLDNLGISCENVYMVRLVGVVKINKVENPIHLQYKFI
jgi:hypothetical protein